MPRAIPPIAPGGPVPARVVHNRVEVPDGDGQWVDIGGMVPGLRLSVDGLNQMIDEYNDRRTGEVRANGRFTVRVNGDERTVYYHNQIVHLGNELRPYPRVEFRQFGEVRGELREVRANELAPRDDRCDCRLCTRQAGEVWPTARPQLWEERPGGPHEALTAEAMERWQREVERREREAEQRRAEYQRQAGERRERIQAANIRAEQLLLRLLSPEQRTSYEKSKYFEFTGSLGTRFRLHPGYSGNVEVLDPDGEAIGGLCAHPNLYMSDGFVLPQADSMIGQWLALRTDEVGFWKVANISSGDYYRLGFHATRVKNGVRYETIIADWAGQKKEKSGPANTIRAGANAGYLNFTARDWVVRDNQVRDNPREIRVEADRNGFRYVRY
jgi:hypothetical protein